MTFASRSIATAAAAVVLVCLSTSAPLAAAQAHVQESGDYVLRASTVSAADLPHRVREQHGIQTDPNTAVLNITVHRKTTTALNNVPARLEVRARNLLGVETDVVMRETITNDLVSYMGTYRFLPREVLSFHITAYPEGAKQSITLQFRDRLGRR